LSRAWHQKQKIQVPDGSPTHVAQMLSDHAFNSHQGLIYRLLITVLRAPHLKAARTRNNLVNGNQESKK